MTPNARQLDVETPPAEALRLRAGEAYARQSRDAMEEQWILQYLPLVRHIVTKTVESLSGTVDVDDLISAGTLGLVKAARAYDRTRKAEFKTYAYIRIRGAVIDELRGRYFLPATVFGKIRRIEAAHQRLLATYGRPPTDQELADDVGISLPKLYRAFEEARKKHFLSIHGLGEGESSFEPLVPRDGEPAPDEVAEQKEMARRLADAIRELPKRSRMILLLYYDRDLTMKETAQVLGVTESRVSQLHASALFKLSMKLKGAS